MNFGIIYGISAFGLSQNIGISRSESKQIIEQYFEEFPAVKEYMDLSIQKARDNEFVETLYGRRRYLKDINSRNAVMRAGAERNAINEEHPDIRALSIYPGIVNTEMQEKIRNTSAEEFPLKQRFIDYFHNNELSDCKTVAEKIFFAGEAISSNYATVHGADLSGKDTALKVIEVLKL